MVILASFILLLTVAIILGDNRLRGFAQLSLTILGLGLLIPETYSFKSKIFEVNALLLPALPFPRSFVTVIMLVSTLVLFVLIFNYSRPLRTKH